MITDIKDIHIGKLIKELWKQRRIPMRRACNFLNCEEKDIKKLFEKESIETDKLLRFSKLLEYDFFRIYSQHLILFSPKSSTGNKIKDKNVDLLKGRHPMFKKTVYTKEIIDYLLGLIYSNEKTPSQIIIEYKIPKSTLYKWIQKYPIEER